MRRYRRLAPIVLLVALAILLILGALRWREQFRRPGPQPGGPPAPAGSVPATVGMLAGGVAPLTAGARAPVSR